MSRDKEEVITNWSPKLDPLRFVKRKSVCDLDASGRNFNYYFVTSAHNIVVVQFAAGGVATPADAALMMQLGCDGVFVGSGVFTSGDATRMARAIVQVVTHYTDQKLLTAMSCALGEAMVGLNIDNNVERHHLFLAIKMEEHSMQAQVILPAYEYHITHTCITP